MMKRLFLILMVLMLILSAVGCNRAAEDEVWADPEIEGETFKEDPDQPTVEVIASPTDLEILEQQRAQEALERAATIPNHFLRHTPDKTFAYLEFLTKDGKEAVLHNLDGSQTPLSFAKINEQSNNTTFSYWDERKTSYTFNSEGELLSCYAHHEGRGYSHPAPEGHISKEDAQVMAEDFIKRTVGDRLQDFTLVLSSENLSHHCYVFRYEVTKENKKINLSYYSIEISYGGYIHSLDLSSPVKLDYEIMAELVPDDLHAKTEDALKEQIKADFPDLAEEDIRFRLSTYDYREPTAETPRTLRASFNETGLHYPGTDRPYFGHCDYYLESGELEIIIYDQRDTCGTK